MATRKPKHSAYRAVPTTDGVQTWVTHSIKLNEPTTTDDVRSFVDAVRNGLPLARIERLRKALIALGDSPTPEIALHAKAIELAIDGMSHIERGAQATWDDLEALDKCDQHMMKIRLLRDVMPKAKKAEKFIREGREVGAVGPLRAAIRAYVARHPDEKPLAVWAGMKSRPPTGHTFFDTKMTGKYIERKGRAEVTFSTFRNLVSLERKALK